MENQFILERIGQTKTQKLLDDCSKEFREIFTKKFPEYNQALHAHSIVSVTENDEIKKIGVSCMNDLLLDNFGKWLGMMLAGSPSNQTLFQTGGVGFDVGVFHTTLNFNQFNVASNAVGTQIAIGQGLTTAQRTDVNIETFFASAPEAGNQSTGNGGWNSGLGKVDIPMVPIGAGGSGLISETCYFAVWHLTNGTFNVSTFCLARDNIAPSVPFIIGQTINVDYALLLS